MRIAAYNYVLSRGRYGTGHRRYGAAMSTIYYIHLSLRSQLTSFGESVFTTNIYPDHCTTAAVHT